MKGAAVLTRRLSFLLLALALLALGLPAAAVAAPTISSLSPTSGAVGATVTITGTAFGSTGTVKFNGTAASTTSWTSTSIVATVPTGATTGNVVVTVSGVNSNGKSFTVVAAPSITSLSVTSGAVAASVTITGANFGATQGSTGTVKFNGTTATVTTWSATSIVTTVPAGATTGNVVLHASGVDSNGKSFTVLPTPAITTLTPSTGAVGASVTIAGSNFSTTQGTVRFNGTAAAVTTWSATSIVAPVPTGATTGNVVVHASGVDSNGSSFTVLPTPSITSLSATSGAVGASVTISGSNFGTTQGTINFNGTAATVGSWSATSIVTSVPTGATTGNVVVHASGVDTNGSSFTVLPTPTVTTVSTTSGAVGAAVTIGGTNFGATQGTVKFNGTSATVTTWSATSIVTSVPAGASTGNVVVHTSGVDANGFSFTVLATPSIANLSPASGGAGAPVTIGGSNFGTTQGTVKFNGTAAAVNTWSATSIATTVPPGATTGNVVVHASGVDTNGVNFTVLPTPTLTSLHIAGSGHIGDVVTLGGTSLGATQGASTVTFNGTVGTPTAWSDTSITVPIPAGATSGNVVVTVSGQASNGVAITVIPPPSLTAVTPGSGRNGDPVTLTGTNFGATKGTSTVTFNGTLATPSAWGDTSISVPVPAGATSGNVVVTVSNQASNGQPFTVSPPPTLTSVTPAIGHISDVVTVTGTNLGATEGTSVVKFNGTLATPSAWGDTSITAPVPAGATSGNIVVTISAQASNGLSFTVIPPPALTFWSIAGSGHIGDVVTVGGTNFGATQGASTITFNGTVGSPTSWSDTSIIAPIPAGATSGNIVVTVSGQASNGAPITVIPPPHLSSLAPVSGLVGTPVTVTGTNFGATKGTSTVSFNGTLATPSTWGDTSVSVPVPAGATSGNIVVTVSSQASNGLSFTVTVPAPIISSLSPSVGNVGTPVSINGSNFGASQGTSTVTFNGVAATSLTSWTATQIAANVPAGATTGPAVVTVGGVSSAGAAFTVPPVLTSITPSTVHISDAVTIVGSNFLATQGTSTVTFNGTAATSTAWSNTSITVPVPVGATSGNVVVSVNGTIPSNGLPFTVIPAPTVTSGAPTVAHVADSVTVTGTNFGATQGSNTLRFNGTAATPTSWADTSVTAPVPSGATTGNIVVTVSNQASNGLPFTVITPGTLSGSVTRVTGGTAVTGASVQAVQTGIVKGSATTAADGSYSIGALDPGTYDVRIVASGFSSELRTPTIVSSATTTLNVAMFVPGAIGGRVTQADGLTPLAGAALTVYAASIAKGTGNTNATGDYTISGLHPGAFTVQAADVGYTTKEQGATATENATTTSNFSLQGAPAAPVLYAYDELNRLVQVTDPAGESAIYRYDAVGNITAIERPGAAGVAISDFTPDSGPIGATVTIFGAGFSGTPSANGVTFGGAPATVLSATATQLTVTAPAAGQIAVSTPSGSANTGSRSFVVATAGPPTITVVAPGTAAAGTALTISGTNFETVPTNENLTINVSPVSITSSTSTTIQSSVPGVATTGRVSVSTTNGTATTASYLWIAPPPFAVADIDTTGTLPFGSGTLLSTSAAGKIALRVFEGIQGHRASIKVNGVTATTNVYLFDAFGVVMHSALVLGDGFVEVSPLRTTATYSVALNSSNSADSATLTLYDVPADFTGTIVADGTQVSVPITTPGQNGTLTFSGTAGQRVSLRGVNGTIAFEVVGCDVNVSILNPDKTVLAGPTCMEGDGFIDATTLPTTGTYTILVDPASYATGTLPLSLYTVTDYAGTITQSGASVNVPITTPGQNGALTFSGTAGERVSLGGTGTIAFQIAGCDVKVSIVRASDDLVVASPTCMEVDGFIDAVTLPTTATYRIVIDPANTATGNLTLTLYDVPPDGSGSLTINATPTNVSLQAPGQNATFSFTVTSSEAVSVHMTSNTFTGTGPCVAVSLTGGSNPSSSSCWNFFDLTQQTLGPGTYTVKIDPVANSVGSLNIQVTTP
jgi:YD repeat-containing protein